MQLHRGGGVARTHRQPQRPRRLVPVGALEDALLALEPEAVGLGDVLGARCEHVEHEPAARLEQRVCRPQGAELLGLVGHVQQRAEGADDERHALVDGGLAQVADPEVDA